MKWRQDAMRFVLFFFMIFCLLMGLLAAMGAGAAWNGNSDKPGFFGILVALFFLGLEARYAYGLGKLERERRLFFPRRHWWQ